MSKDSLKKTVRNKENSRLQSPKSYSSKTFITKRKKILEKDSTSEQLSAWGWPSLILLGSTLIIYALLVFFDFDLSKSSANFAKSIFTTTPENITDATGSFVELLAAILGIVITVVAIVLQLAAQRYGTRLIDLFIADRLNRIYFFFMVCSLMYAILIVFTIKASYFPFYAVETLLFLTLFEITLLAPYFLYVFKFLTPTNLLSSIQETNRTSIINSTNRQNFSNLKRYQKEVANAIEQVTDSALSANSQMDRNLSLMAINQLREMVLDYLENKTRLPKPWFLVSQDFFIGISSEFYKDICEKRLWFEAKTFMDMELIFKNSIRNMPDGVSAIAYNTRIIGEFAIRNRDDALLDLVVQFYNTFIRLALNEKNVRAIFNLFYQYRLLAESVFDYNSDIAQKIVFYFKYYGETGLQQGLWFVLYTAAFDLGSMVATAFDKKMTNIREILFIFMQLEDNIDKKKDMMALTGVRKSQLILAAYLFSKGNEDLVKLVVEDLKNETLERLLKWRDMLLDLKERKFWEITDRGINFEYIDDEQKKYLELFYEKYILPQVDSFRKD
ncbi:MAG: DUF2254 domain-containing protein [Deltaproteobacteria bacterium]|nr:DUF2254 domain-containing protein [Deltaproteobacteria bacterium]